MENPIQQVSFGTSGPYPSLHVAGAHVKEKMRNMQIDCQNYAYDFGVDKPEIDNWKWPY